MKERMAESGAKADKIGVVYDGAELKELGMKKEDKEHIKEKVREITQKPDLEINLKGLLEVKNQCLLYPTIFLP